MDLCSNDNDWGKQKIKICPSVTGIKNRPLQEETGSQLPEAWLSGNVKSCLKTMPIFSVCTLQMAKDDNCVAFSLLQDTQYMHT